MSARHTPGPWVVRNGCNVFADAAHIPLTNAAYIACTGGLSGMDTIERDAANARLIASAPDMLELLKRAADFIQPFNRGEDLLNEIDAVIAKACGDDTLARATEALNDETTTMVALSNGRLA